MRSSLIAALAAASLVVAPTVSIAATASDASALSLQGQVRVGAETGDANRLEGSMLIIGLVAVAVIIALILLLDDDDDPESP